MLGGAAPIVALCRTSLQEALRDARTKLKDATAWNKNSEDAIAKLKAELAAQKSAQLALETANAVLEGKANELQQLFMASVNTAEARQEELERMLTGTNETLCSQITRLMAELEAANEQTQVALAAKAGADARAEQAEQEATDRADRDAEELDALRQAPPRRDRASARPLRRRGSAPRMHLRMGPRSPGQSGLVHGGCPQLVAAQHSGGERYPRRWSGMQTRRYAAQRDPIGPQRARTAHGLEGQRLQRTQMACAAWLRASTFGTRPHTAYSGLGIAGMIGAGAGGAAARGGADGADHQLPKGGPEGKPLSVGSTPVSCSAVQCRAVPCRAVLCAVPCCVPCCVLCCVLCARTDSVPVDPSGPRAAQCRLGSP
jgi:hypothetical protein